jgi:hypothetical protein
VFPIDRFRVFDQEVHIDGLADADALLPVRFVFALNPNHDDRETPTLK